MSHLKTSPIRMGDWMLERGLLGAGLIVLLLFVLYLIMLTTASFESFQEFGFGFLISHDWNPVSHIYGAIPFIYGTTVSSLIAIVLASIIGVSAAVFLTQFAPAWLAGPVLFLIELLAAIPSVVYGLWGIFFLAPLLRTSVQPWLQKYFGFLPLFQGSMYGIGMLAAGIILAIMILPTITAIVRDVIMTVPREHKEAALGLGATKWEMVRLAVLPYSMAGILGGIMLALGRALGETMAVTMVIGNRPEVSASLFAPSYTMASVIANEFTEATSSIHIAALTEIGLVLFMVTIVFYLGARFLISRVNRV
ncbi:phosphate ABC transporter permease subunit PstC [Pelosinus sp. IPA-1]|uniref:phosphate ABC transporter permease subunit PstC n=1 Tax=Pelosinus sp. IPA-1 TaxID=3029569 RepID=UPI0024361EEE|nr:phosphate ABC transporter permease subunit PstC [Pelosinus sp. IPA-1]GMB01011.1 phosphate transport system permease protein [Pelosinus sp. IPA-1]